MPTLEAQQSAEIADAITQFAAAINDYLDANDVAEPLYSKLNRLQTQLVALGGDWEQKAAQTDYADATAASSYLSKATSAIEAAKQRLEQQVADIGKIAALVGTVADFALALSGGVAGPILAAAGNVAAAAHE